MNIVIVGMGGVLGALARYYINLPLNSESIFPWGTLAVNLIGSFFLAYFLTLALRCFSHHSFIILSVSTGFTGALTTFSSVSVEAVTLAHKSALLFLVYVGTSIFAGLIMAFAGRYLGKTVNILGDEKAGAGGQNQ